MMVEAGVKLLQTGKVPQNREILDIGTRIGWMVRIILKIQLV